MARCIESRLMTSDDPMFNEGVTVLSGCFLPRQLKKGNSKEKQAKQERDQPKEKTNG